jgi:RNA polymerase sigma-70 factor, ECF subfamily
MTPPARDITTLLGLLNGPDPQPQVQEELYRRVEGELRKIAEAFMKRQRPLYSLEPTLLIDHAFQKLAGGQEINWGNRVHFYRFAARVMRQLIVDEVRRERAAIRGGGQAPMPLERAAEPADPRLGALQHFEDLNEALTRLEGTDPELFEVVQLHHFGGLTLDEVARTLELSPATVKRYWRMALAFLHRELGPRDDSHVG